MTERIKLLLTEDPRDTTKISKGILSEKGYNVETCQKDGRAVLTAIKNSLPDVVIMDMYMPSFDAPAVCKAITNCDIGKKPVIIVTSNYENDFMEKEAQQAGAACIFMKPFDYDVLCERIEKLCSSKPLLSKSSDSKSLSELDLEVMVTEILHQIGVPAHIKGYQYLRTSILLSIENRDRINHITKELYPTVAKKYKTTATRVERAIRHAIEVAWDRGDVDVLNAYFGYTIHSQKGKPTNSEFVAMISDKIGLKIKAM
ncbi:MAG: sporulation transcription factor Spo0A [Oscillospiraceae bacterium]|nr:sporulation transcription factor Spo0A [Oscillospiraceae bacterium]